MRILSYTVKHVSYPPSTTTICSDPFKRIIRRRQTKNILKSQFEKQVLRTFLRTGFTYLHRLLSEVLDATHDVSIMLVNCNVIERNLM